MIEGNHNVVNEDGSPKSQLEFFLRVLLVLFILFAGMQSVFDENLPGSVHFAYYLAFIFIWIISFRYTNVFIVLVGGRKPVGMLLLLLQFFIMLFVINKHKFNGMPLINDYVICCTVAFGVLFSISILYRNNNIKLPGFQNTNFVVPVVLLGLLMGYGFSLACNCSGIVDSPKFYSTAIRFKHIETGRSKNGIYHTPHFGVQSWPQSAVFGNDIIVPEKWFNRYDNIAQIKVGDSVLLVVHPGLLDLSWMEPVKFVEVP